MVGSMHITLLFINPRRACARVTVVVLRVCVYLSVTTLAASAFVYTCNQRYSQVSLTGFSILIRGFSKNPSVQK